ncbi:phosphotransferase [Schaalia sp. ZJ405]|uniref:phosphotransferase n=1 Tax=Schaalia sp. ZJ405 TaxID=2709403 RepID=UPI0013ECE1BD|nr:phosphotransferase [Schaalia sp. ZJ405]QPK80844.1 phosphotransferase [Schaalia sp. ZJ405]
MTKSPLELAALATAAVPGMQVERLCSPQYDDEVMSVTGIVDSSGNRWVVSCPHDAIGGLDLAAQSGLLERLAKAYDVKRIPFDVPRIHGMTTTHAGDRIMVHQNLGGRALTDADFSDPHILPASLGRALAALHNLPPKVYTGIDLPAYSAIECRDRLIALVDEAAEQVLIPANLWNRWEAAFDDVALWRFPAAPIHGDLQQTNLEVDHGSVLGMGGFGSAHVGDPAVDIAWILAQASDEFLDRFVEAYSRDRSFVDLHLITRAQLLSELAIVRWLVHGIHAQDRSIIAQAQEMLSDLSMDLGDDQLVRRPSPMMSPSAQDSSASSPEEQGQDPSELDRFDDTPNPQAQDGADEEIPTEPLSLDMRSDLHD